MSQPPPWTPQWSTPPPPEGRPGQIRPGRLWLGIGLAALGHLLTIVVLLIGLFATPDTREVGALNGLFAGLAAQGVLFVAVLVASIVLSNRGDRSVGLGLIIGWAVGLLVAPVVGFGVCVALLSGTS